MSLSSTNRLFVEKLQNPGHKKQAEERLTNFLRMRVYEDSAWAKILPPKPISAAQCDRIPASEGNGTALLRKVIDKEFTDVSAVGMDFRGRGSTQYVDTDTFNADFYKISSPEFKITEEELRAKELPLQQILKNAITSHIDRTIDVAAHKACVTAVGSTGKDLSTPDDYILPRNLVDLVNAIEGQGGNKTLEVATLLMTKAMYNQIYKWPQSDISNLVGTEFWADGYKYPKLKGLRIVVTNKSDVFSNDEVWAFVAPEFLGVHYEMNDDRFEIQKDWSTLSFMGWKTHSSTIGNAEGVARMRFKIPTP